MSGTVSPNAEWDDDYQQWKYRVTGTDYELEPLILIVAIEERFNRITIVTGMGE